MTRNEMVEQISRFFKIEIPKKNEHGEYVCEGYEWEVGGYLGIGGELCTLQRVVKALEELCEEEDPYDKWDCEQTRDDWDEEN
jgi:hypothetical protein